MWNKLYKQLTDTGVSPDKLLYLVLTLLALPLVLQLLVPLLRGLPETRILKKKG
jgi:hypothetical protein